MTPTFCVEKIVSLHSIELGEYNSFIWIFYICLCLKKMQNKLYAKNKNDIFVLENTIAMANFTYACMLSYQFWGTIYIYSISYFHNVINVGHKCTLTREKKAL